MNKAVFLDRDGTVNEEVGYLSDLRQLKLLPGAAAAIKRLNDAGFKVVLVTNQSGVARGYFPETFVHKTHELLTQMLSEEGAKLDGIYYCPHHPRSGSSHYTRECDCRKPATGLLDQASRDLSIDLRTSFMVGDKWSDVELGQRAGCRSILVRSGFSHDDPGNVRPSRMKDPDFIAHDLAEAADWVLARGAGQGA
ncbi:MAG: HAD family hydrolase [Nitrospirota bacterium]|nr:HAD family hydrolase [Nitrospirota bacterium]